jgi:hypothetical protein
MAIDWDQWSLCGVKWPNGGQIALVASFDERMFLASGSK